MDTENEQYHSIVEPYLSVPIDSDEYTQKLHANLTELKDELHTDETQMILVAHRFEQTGQIPWQVMSKRQRFFYLLNIFLRLLSFIISLYTFIVTLDLMTSAFILLSRSALAQIFQSRIFLKSPIVSLMLGILITTILQSSSTVTSSIVAMVGSGIIEDIRSVIPMIMGANIGTSITNTLVAFSQIGNRNEFSRSFSSGVLMDVFNYLTTLVLLSLEIFVDRITVDSDIFHRGGYLARISGAIATTIPEKRGADIQLLKTLTKPLTRLIIQIDEEVMISNEANQTLGKIYCNHPAIKCEYLFRAMIEKFGDNVVGIILLICSLILLTGILLLMVKLLKSLIIGVIDDTLKKILYIKSHGCKEYFLGYVFILVGIVGAILVQSSIGLEVLALERNYELTIGANIGTTVTALLASLTQTGLFFRQSIQIALTHFLFNLSGCILWYIFPYLRRLPVYFSRQIGEIVSKYRWFAFVYLTMIFFIFPLVILCLALIHWIVAIVFLFCCVLILISVSIIGYLQKNKPNRLPMCLRSWSFLPHWCRSLSYWDDRLEHLTKRICCQRCVQLIYPSIQTEKPLRDQYLTMKDQYVTALDHRYLVHTHQLHDFFEKHYASVVPTHDSKYPLTTYMQSFYHSLTGKPTQDQRALFALMHDEDEQVDRVIVFDRDKRKDISIVNEQKSSLSF
ncbi:unnamed protein product [Adineta ricciae]|uniref:Uncharacterized protein n=1 Tax=Adineta ricciae TaxID=249248 RepID=A0A815P6F0_ADIRI|nr:unnamed protein product [Adineta ricciae]CAF1444745.1 unnamed protein product [Adineta ricciae]